MTQPKRLIINADDCNLTRGVTRGILQAYDQGILTSTTLLINLPLEEKTVKELLRRRELGVGLHLNVTLGIPLSSPEKVPSLVQSDGRFRRPPEDFKKLSPYETISREVILEYETQIQFFERRFGKKPDHLDTHHHLHDDSLFFKALSDVAREQKIPIRRCRLFQISDYRHKTQGLKTTDYLFGNLEARFLWQERSFWGIVENLPEGTSEIACHPGFCDAKLREMSSLRESREEELKLFSDKRLRKKVSSVGVELIRFSEI